MFFSHGSSCRRRGDTDSRSPILSLSGSENQGDMGIRVLSSAQLGLVVVVFEGFIEGDEFAHGLTPLIGDSGLALLPKALIDATRAEGTSIESGMVQSAANKARAVVDPHLSMPDPKLAIVAIRDEFFGLGRMY